MGKHACFAGVGTQAGWTLPLYRYYIMDRCRIQFQRRKDPDLTPFKELIRINPSNKKWFRTRPSIDPPLKTDLDPTLH